MNECVRCPLNDGPVERPCVYTCACALSGRITEQLDMLFELQSKIAGDKSYYEKLAERESALTEDELAQSRNDEGDYEKLPGCTPAETAYFEWAMNIHAMESARKQMEDICRYGYKTPEAPNQLHLFSDQDNDDDA